MLEPSGQVLALLLVLLLVLLKHALLKLQLMVLILRVQAMSDLGLLMLEPRYLDEQFEEIPGLLVAALAFLMWQGHQSVLQVPHLSVVTQCL